MNPTDIANKLRHVVFDGRGKKLNASLGIDLCELLLVAACALEEKNAEIENEKAMRQADWRFLESLCKAAIHDLKFVTTKRMLCECCKHLREDGECDSPFEHEDNCWEWRGMCLENEMED